MVGLGFPPSNANFVFFRFPPAKLMSQATVTGVVHLIEPTKEYGQKGFRKRLVVLEQDKGSFTNYVPLEFIKDGCDTADEMNEGDEVEVTYRLSGRRWQKDTNAEPRYFVNLEALSFRIVGDGGGGSTMSERITDANDALDEVGDEAPPF